jgi:hypothetical protein
MFTACQPFHGVGVMDAVEADEDVIDGSPGEQGSFLTVPSPNRTAGEPLQVQRAEISPQARPSGSSPIRSEGGWAHAPPA